MDKASFSLEKYSFDKVSIDFALTNSREIEKIDLSPSGMFEQHEKNSIYKLKFVFTAKGQGELNPFVIVECNAVFRFANNTSFNEIPPFFYANSIAILFPYIRAFISTVTLQANYPPILLPTMNLSSLEQLLRANTIEKKGLMTLYQTVEDRDNPDVIETNAPFICKRKDAWLGEGYYFWDTFIENAHWWGQKVYSYGYVISEYSCDFSSDKCFDLQGNMEHIKIFNETIEFLKKNTDFESTYDAIRISHNLKPLRTIFFNPTKPEYFNCTPVVQLCLFRKNSLGLSNGKIVYPAHYNIGYMV